MLNLLRSNRGFSSTSVHINRFFLINRTLHGQEKRDGPPSAALSRGTGRWCAGSLPTCGAERARGAFPGVPAGGVASAGGHTSEPLEKSGALTTNPFSVLFPFSCTEVPEVMFLCCDILYSLFQEGDLLMKILESYIQSRKWWTPAFTRIRAHLHLKGSNE